MTFAAWFDAALAVAYGLVRRGVVPGARVGIVCRDRNWLDYCSAVLGTQLAAAVAVPFRMPIEAESLRALAARIEVGLIIREQDAYLSPGCPSVTFTELLKTRGNPANLPVVTGDAPASIVFTSGTSDTAKAIVCTHDNLVADWDGDARSPAPGVFLTSVAIGTNAAQAVLCSTLANGNHTVLLQQPDPAVFLDLARLHAASGIGITPTLARLLITSRSLRGVESVRTVVVSSSPLDRDTVARLAKLFDGASIVNSYTLSEGGSGLAAECLPGQAPRLGRPGPDDDVRLMTAANKEAKVGEVGELWVRGDQGKGRYYADPAGQVSPTSTRILADGWIATGDLCTRDAENYISFVGRADDVVISGDVNVSTIAVEGVLKQHPSVRDAAAFGVPHSTLGEQVIAAVVLVSDATVEELRRFCAGKLRPQECPAQVVVTAELPTTASGKVVKRDLRAGYLAERDGLPTDSAPEATPMERIVMEVFEGVLGCPAGPSSSYFDLGGQSLLAIIVADELTDRVGVTVPAESVLAHPVVSDLASQIVNAAGSQ